MMRWRSSATACGAADSRARQVLGRSVTIDGQTCTIVGVAPPRFHGLSIEYSADLWISSRDRRAAADDRASDAGRHARSSASRDAGALPSARPGAARRVRSDERMQIELLPAGKGLSELRAQYERPLLALTGLVTLVLLITCTNVGNLLMVRNGARRRELTVRAALGARRSRLVLQSLVESAVLAAMGGVLALVFARWGVSIMLSMLPLTAIPEALAFHADARVLGFAAGVSMLSALLFGLAPAWRATHVDLTAALRSSQGSTPTKRTRRWAGRWWPARWDYRCSCWLGPDCSSRHCGI